MTIFQDSEDLSSSDDDGTEDSIESPFAEGMRMPDPVTEDVEEDDLAGDKGVAEEDEFLPTKGVSLASNPVQGSCTCRFFMLLLVPWPYVI